jgi:hypothetical protein
MATMSCLVIVSVAHDAHRLFLSAIPCLRCYFLPGIAVRIFIPAFHVG